MFENPRRSGQARNFTTNVPKILDLKSSPEQIFFRKLSLGAPASPGRQKSVLKKTMGCFVRVSPRDPGRKVPFDRDCRVCLNTMLK